MLSVKVGDFNANKTDSFFLNNNQNKCAVLCVYLRVNIAKNRKKNFFFLNYNEEFMSHAEPAKVRRFV